MLRVIRKLDGIAATADKTAHTHLLTVMRANTRFATDTGMRNVKYCRLCRKPVRPSRMTPGSSINSFRIVLGWSFVRSASSSAVKTCSLSAAVGLFIVFPYWNVFNSCGVFGASNKIGRRLDNRSTGSGHRIDLLVPHRVEIVDGQLLAEATAPIRREAKPQAFRDFIRLDALDEGRIAHYAKPGERLAFVPSTDCR